MGRARLRVLAIATTGSLVLAGLVAAANAESAVQAALHQKRNIQERGFFVPVTTPEGRPALFPGSPIRFSYGTGEPAAPPRLGADTEAVLAGAAAPESRP